MRRFLLSFGISIFILGLVSYIFLFHTPWAGRSHDEIEKQLIIKTQTGQEHVFDLELALTLTELRDGLMHRESLPEKTGMLFLFGVNEPRNFWMKNTLIPLDIIFILSDGTIHHIHKNAKPLDETQIYSNGPVWSVLEINGGLTSKLGIQVGDKVIHSEFQNNLFRSEFQK